MCRASATPATVSTAWSTSLTASFGVGSGAAWNARGVRFIFGAEVGSPESRDDDARTGSAHSSNAPGGTNSENAGVRTGSHDAEAGRAATRVTEPEAKPVVERECAAPPIAEQETSSVTEPGHGATPVAVVIPAKDEADRIEATVRAAATLPGVDTVVVVDDGSTDDTATQAERAGARVVRHHRNCGKAAAMESGARAVAEADTRNGATHLLLFADADLGDSAGALAPLIGPVRAGRADVTVAVLPKQAGAGGHGFVMGLGRRAIERATGWVPVAPLSGQRCMTRAAFEAATPLAPGWGVEVGMSIDVLAKGFTVQEVRCELHHRATGNNLRGYLHRAAQYRGVLRAVMIRRLRGVTVPAALRTGMASTPFEPYRARR